MKIPEGMDVEILQQLRVVGTGIDNGRVNRQGVRILDK